MTPAERNLETLITNATHALAMCPDPLLVKAQKALIALRTPDMVAEMERRKGIDQRQRQPWPFPRSQRRG